jgi:hypothetical protein
MPHLEITIQSRRNPDISLLPEQKENLLACAVDVMRELFGSVVTQPLIETLVNCQEIDLYTEHSDTHVQARITHPIESLHGKQFAWLGVGKNFHNLSPLQLQVRVVGTESQVTTWKSGQFYE